MATDYKQYNYNATYCGGSFASQGCGPTSVADLLNRSPLEIADWMTKNGAATTDGHGTYWDGINRCLSAYGADGKMLGSSMDGVYNSEVFDRWKAHIQSGYMGVLLMHNVINSFWTTSGHYIAVVAYDPDADKYLVYDPASVTRTGWHAWSDFVGNICCLYTSNIKWGEVKPADDEYVFTVKELKHGATGKQVRFLQRLLKSRGLYKGKIDGSYGDKTRDAVLAYQKFISEHGGNLKQDGVCGPNTWTSLLGFKGVVSGSKVTFTVKQVKPGDQSVYVYLVQQLLAGWGYYQSVLDFDFGLATRQAVIDFQKKKGIAQDGVAGPATFKLMIGF